MPGFLRARICHSEIFQLYQNFAKFVSQITLNKRWGTIVKVPPLDAYLALVMYDNLTPPPFAEINFSPKDGYLGAPCSRLLGSPEYFISILM